MRTGELTQNDHVLGLLNNYRPGPLDSRFREIEGWGMPQGLT